MSADRTPAATAAERYARHLAAQSRYNNSEAGRARRKRYREGLAVGREAARPPKATTSLEKLAEMVK